MWQFLALMLTLLSTLILYLTNRHQRLLTMTIPKKWRIASAFLWLGSLLVWLQLYTNSAAIFLWLLSTMLLAKSIPLLSLLKRRGVAHD